MGGRRWWHGRIAQLSDPHRERRRYWLRWRLPDLLVYEARLGAR